MDCQIISMGNMSALCAQAAESLISHDDPFSGGGEGAVAGHQEVDQPEPRRGTPQAGSAR